MGKKWRYYKWKWVIFIIPSANIGFFIEEVLSFRLYDYFNNLFGNSLTERQVDGLYHLFTHRYTIGIFFTLFIWMLITNIILIINVGQIKKKLDS